MAHSYSLEIGACKVGGMEHFNMNESNDTMQKLDLNHIHVAMATWHTCKLRRLCRHYTTKSLDWIATANRWQLGNALIWS